MAGAAGCRQKGPLWLACIHHDSNMFVQKGMAAQQRCHKACMRKLSWLNCAEAEFEHQLQLPLM
jgi:hypothetical protein